MADTMKAAVLPAIRQSGERITVGEDSISIEQAEAFLANLHAVITACRQQRSANRRARSAAHLNNLVPC